MAAALMGSMLALSGCVTWRCCSDGRLPGQLATSVGEQRSIALSDGSMVSLNTQSNVRIDRSPGARHVYLIEGQALFAVARDRTRRFRVYVGNAVVIGDGARFDVKRTTNRTDIAVVEGRVRVEAATSHDAEPRNPAGAQERVWLAAGEATSIVADRNVTAPALIDVDDVIAWRHRRLIFRSSTLPEMAEEIGRYNRALRIRFEGDEFRTRRYAGVLDADGSGLIAYLKSDTSVVLERDGHGFVVRPNPAPALSEPTL